MLDAVATSLLWSVFESWMISEHYAHGYDLVSLGGEGRFSLVSVGNGLIAFVSGLVAQWAVDTCKPPAAPFDVSAVLLIVCPIFFVDDVGSELWNPTKQSLAAVACCLQNRV
ncbi:hypothetical protein TcCL_ESM02849 [Trypanosoma cruzi]|nr:hypothetical protein TcCL_ESM02849 [Trypanosoma cruzi]